jgi:hypothetical protein
MRKKQLSILAAFVVAISFCSYQASAKVWRVNNNAGINAHFTQIGQAINSASVQNDDTLYIEGSATNYEFTFLYKRLVFIGAGYLLSGTGSNPGLQANPFPANFANMDIDSLASGSSFIGISGYFRIDANVDDLKFIRTSVYIDPRSTFANSTAKNWVINKCLLGTGNLSYRFENLQITNCIGMYNQVLFPNSVNGLIRNNVFAIPLTTENAYVANNIFLSNLTVTNSTVKYNISTSNNLPSGNNNLINVPSADIFVDTGSNDGRYQLRTGSPAIAAGEPVSGVTPDIGAFGTADPYRLSGIAPIPTIYSLSVPASIPATATSMTITFSTRSNN